MCLVGEAWLESRVEQRAVKRPREWVQRVQRSLIPSCRSLSGSLYRLGEGQALLQLLLRAQSHPCPGKEPFLGWRGRSGEIRRFLAFPFISKTLAFIEVVIPTLWTCEESQERGLGSDKWLLFLSWLSACCCCQGVSQGWSLFPALPCRVSLLVARGEFFWV